MSTTAQDTTASTGNSNSSVTSKPSGSSSVPIAIGVTLGLLVLIILAGLAYFYGYRRRRKGWVDVKDRRRETVVGPGHVASHVTPFYPFRGEGPRFAHTPGEGMRVAHRREDGGWEFSDSHTIVTPITPFNELGSPVCLSPTTSVFTVKSIVKKEKKVPGELTTRGFIETNIYDPVPPAYTRSPTTPVPPRTSLGDS